MCLATFSLSRGTRSLSPIRTLPELLFFKGWESLNLLFTHKQGFKDIYFLCARNKSDTASRMLLWQSVRERYFWIWIIRKTEKALTVITNIASNNPIIWPVLMFPSRWPHEESCDTCQPLRWQLWQICVSMVPPPTSPHSGSPKKTRGNELAQHIRAASLACTLSRMSFLCSLRVHVQITGPAASRDIWEERTTH